MGHGQHGRHGGQGSSRKGSFIAPLESCDPRGGQAGDRAAQEAALWVKPGFADTPRERSARLAVIEAAEAVLRAKANEEAAYTEAKTRAAKVVEAKAAEAKAAEALAAAQAAEAARCWAPSPQTTSATRSPGPPFGGRTFGGG